MSLVINNLGEFIDNTPPKLLRLKNGPASRRIDYERKEFAKAHAKAFTTECAWCGEKFTTRHRNQLYCSKDCKNAKNAAAARERRKKAV